MKWILPLLLLAWSAGLLRDWREQSSGVAGGEPAGAGAAAPLHDPAGASRERETPDWLEPLLGGRLADRQAPAPAELRTLLAAAWALEEAAGWELLSGGSAATAARIELRRWLEAPPSAWGQAEKLEIAPREGGLELRATLAGPAAALLPWLARLLALPPRAGYLTDPAQVRLRHRGAATLEAQLAVRVFPASRWLGQEPP